MKKYRMDNSIMKKWRQGISLVLVCAVLLSSNATATFAQNADSIWEKLFAPHISALRSANTSNADDITVTSDDKKVSYASSSDALIDTTYKDDDIENGYEDIPEEIVDVDSEKYATNSDATIEAPSIDITDDIEKEGFEEEPEDVDDADNYDTASRSEANEDIDDASNEEADDTLSTGVDDADNYDTASRSNADEEADDASAEDIDDTSAEEAEDADNYDTDNVGDANANVGDALYASRSEADEEVEDEEIVDLDYDENEEEIVNLDYDDAEVSIATDSEVVDLDYDEDEVSIATDSEVVDLDYDEGVEDANANVGNADSYDTASRSNADIASPSEIATESEISTEDEWLFDDMLTMEVNKLQSTTSVEYYDEAGGSVWTNPYRVTVDTTDNPEGYIRLAQPPKQREGYKFIGWLHQPSGKWNREWWVSPPGVSIMPADGARTFYAQWKKDGNEKEEGKVTYLDREGNPVETKTFDIGDKVTLKRTSLDFTENGKTYGSYGWCDYEDVKAGNGNMIDSTEVNVNVMLADKDVYLPKDIKLQEVFVEKSDSFQRFGKIKMYFKDEKGNILKTIDAKWDESIFLPTEEDVGYSSSENDIEGWKPDREIKWRNSNIEHSGIDTPWPPGMSFALESEDKSYHNADGSLPTEMVWTAHIVPKLRIQYYNVDGKTMLCEETCDRGFNTLPSRIEDILKEGITADGTKINYPVSGIRTQPNRKSDYLYPGSSIDVYTRLADASGIVKLYVDTAFTINFDENDGTWLKSHLSQTFDVYETQSLALPPATDLYYIGHNFLGWSFDEDGKKSVKDSSKLSYDEIKSDYIKENGNITLYAMWGDDASAYNFTYGIDWNEGDGYWGRGNKPQNYWTKDVTQEIILPTTDNTKSIYIYSSDNEFGGWYTKTGKTQNSEKLTINDFSASNLTEGFKLELNALWGKIYTISYKLNGGAWEEGYNPQTKYMALDTLVLPTGKNMYYERYGFEGWYFDDNYKDKVPNGTLDSESIKNYTSSSTIYLYAKWKNDPSLDDFTYRITFFLHDGSWKQGYTKPSRWKKGTTPPTLPTDANVTRPYYEFKGWYYTDDYSGDIIKAIDAKYLEDKDELVLHAKWALENADYILRFNINKDTTKWSKGEPITQWDSENPYTLPTGTDLYYTGHQFKGWYFDKDYKYQTGKVLNNTNIDGHITRGDKNYIDLYPLWEVPTVEPDPEKIDDFSYKIEYENIEGCKFKDGYELPSVWITKTKTLPALPTSDDIQKDKHDLMGWYFDEDFSTQATGPALTIENFKKYANRNNNFTVTLYARWEPSEVTVKYDLGDDAMFADEKQQYEEIWQITDELDLPTKIIAPKNKYCIGWYYGLDRKKVENNKLLSAEYYNYKNYIIVDEDGKSVLKLTAGYDTYVIDDEDKTGPVKEIKIKIYHDNKTNIEQFAEVTTKKIYAKTIDVGSGYLGEEYKYLLIGESEAELENANTAGNVQQILDMTIDYGDPNHTFTLSRINKKGLRYSMNKNFSESSEKFLDASWDLMGLHKDINDWISQFEKSDAITIYVRDSINDGDEPLLATMSMPSDYKAYNALKVVGFRMLPDSPLEKTMYMPYGDKFASQDFPTTQNKFDEPPQKWVFDGTTTVLDTSTYYVTENIVLLAQYKERPKITIVFDLGGGYFKSERKESDNMWDTSENYPLPKDVIKSKKLCVGWATNKKIITGWELKAKDYYLETKYVDDVETTEDGKLELHLYALYTEYKTDESPDVDVDSTERQIELKIYHKISDDEYEPVPNATKILYVKYAKTNIPNQSQEEGDKYNYYYLLIGETQGGPKKIGKVEDILDMSIKYDDWHSLYLKNINANGLRLSDDNTFSDKDKEIFLDKNWDLTSLHDGTKKIIDLFMNSGVTKKIYYISDNINVGDAPELQSTEGSPIISVDTYRALKKVSFKKYKTDNTYEKVIYVPFNMQIKNEEYPEVKNANNDEPEKWIDEDNQKEFDNETRITLDTKLYAVYKERPTISISYDLKGGKFNDNENHTDDTWNVAEDSPLPTSVIGPTGKVFIGWSYEEGKVVTELKREDYDNNEYINAIQNNKLNLSAVYDDYKGGKITSQTKKIIIKLYHDQVGENKSYQLVADLNINVDCYNTTNAIGDQYKYLTINGKVANVSQILSMPIYYDENDDTHVIYLENINEKGLRYSTNSNFSDERFLEAEWDLIDKYPNVYNDFIYPFVNGNTNTKTIFVRDSINSGDEPKLPDGVAVPSDISEFRGLNEVSYKKKSSDSSYVKSMYLPYGQTIKSSDHPHDTDDIKNDDGDEPINWIDESTNEPINLNKKIVKDTYLHAEYPDRPKIIVYYNLGEDGSFRDKTKKPGEDVWDTKGDFDLYLEIEAKKGMMFDGWYYKDKNENNQKILDKKLHKDEYLTKYKDIVVEGTLTLYASYKDIQDSDINVNPGPKIIDIKIYHREKTAPIYTEITNKIIYAKWSKSVATGYTNTRKYLTIGETKESLANPTGISTVEQLLDMDISYEYSETPFKLKNINSKGLRYSLNQDFTDEHYLDADWDFVDIHDVIDTDFITPFTREVNAKEKVTIYVRDTIEEGDEPSDLSVPDNPKEFRLFKKVTFAYKTSAYSKDVFKTSYVVSGSKLDKKAIPTKDEEHKVTDTKTDKPLNVWFYSTKPPEDTTAVKYDFDNEAINEDTDFYAHRFFITLKFSLNENQNQDIGKFIVENWMRELGDNKMELKNASSDSYTDIIWYGNDVTFGHNTVTKNNNDFLGWKTSSGVAVNELKYDNYASIDYNDANRTRTLYASYRPYSDSEFTKVVNDKPLRIHLYDGAYPPKEIGIEGEIRVDIWKRSNSVNEYFLTKHSTDTDNLRTLSVEELLNTYIPTTEGQQFRLGDINEESLIYKLALDADISYDVDKTELFNSDNTTLSNIINLLRSRIGTNQKVDMYVEAVNTEYYVKATFKLEDYSGMDQYYKEKEMYVMKYSEIDFTPNGDLKDIENIKNIEWYTKLSPEEKVTSSKYQISKNTTFYGKVKNHIIKFDPNGGVWIASKSSAIKELEISSTDDKIALYTIKDVENGDKQLTAWSYSSNKSLQNQYLKDSNTGKSLAELEYDEFISYIKERGLVTRYGTVTLYAIWDDIKDENSRKEVEGATLRISLVDEAKGVEEKVYGDIKVNVYTTTKGVSEISYIREVTNGTPSKDILKVSDYINKTFKLDDGTEWKLANINNASLLYGTSINNTDEYNASTDNLINTKNAMTEAIVTGLINDRVNNIYTIYVSDNVKDDHEPGFNNTPTTDVGVDLFHTVTWTASSGAINYATTSIVGNRHYIKENKRKSIEEDVNRVYVEKAISYWKDASVAGDMEFKFDNTSISGDITLVGQLGGIQILYHAEGGKWKSNTNVDGEIKVQNIPDNGTIIKYYSHDDITNGSKILEGWSFEKGGEIIKDADGSVESYAQESFIEKARTYITDKGKINLYAIWQNVIDEDSPTPGVKNATKVASNITLIVSILNDDLVEKSITGSIMVNAYKTTSGVGTIYYLKRVEDEVVSDDILSVEEYIHEIYELEDGTKWSLSNINNQALVYNTNKIDYTTYTVDKDSYMMSNVSGAKPMIDGIYNLSAGSSYKIYVNGKVNENRDDMEDGFSPIVGSQLFREIFWQATKQKIYEKTTFVVNGTKIKNTIREAIEEEVSKTFINYIVTYWKRISPYYDGTPFDFENTIIYDDTAFDANVKEIYIKYHSQQGTWVSNVDVEGDIKTVSTNKIDQGFIMFCSTDDVRKGDEILAGWTYEIGKPSVKSDSGEVYRCEQSKFVEDARSGGYLKDGVINLYAIWDNIRDEKNEETEEKRNSTRIGTELSLIVSLVNENNKREFGIKGEVKVNVYATSGVGSYNYLRIVENNEISEDILVVSEYIGKSYVTSKNIKWSLAHIDNTALTYGTNNVDIRGNRAYNVSKDVMFMTNNDAMKPLINGLVDSIEEKTYTFTIYVGAIVQPNHTNGNIVYNTPDTDNGISLFHEVTWSAIGEAGEGINYSTITIVANGQKIVDQDRLPIENSINETFKDRMVSSWKEILPTPQESKFDFSNTKIKSDITLLATMDWIKIVYHAEGGIWLDGNAGDDTMTKDISVTEGGYIKYSSIHDVTNDDMILLGWSFGVGKDIIKDKDGNIDRCEKYEFLNMAKTYIVNKNEIHLYANWGEIKDVENETSKRNWNSKKVLSNVTLKVRLIDDKGELGVEGTTKVHVYVTQAGIGTFSYIRKALNEEKGSENIMKVEDYIKEKYDTDGVVWSLANINNEKLTYGVISTNPIKYNAPISEYMLSTSHTVGEMVDGLTNAGEDGSYTIYVNSKVSANHTDASPTDNAPELEVGVSIFHRVYWQAQGVSTKTSIVGNKMKISDTVRNNIETEIREAIITKIVSGWNKIETGKAPKKFNFATLVDADITLDAIYEFINVRYKSEGVWIDNTGVTGDGVKTKRIVDSEEDTIVDHYTMKDVINNGKVLTGWSFEKNSTTVIRDIYDSPASCPLDKFVADAISGGYILSNGDIEVYAVWVDAVLDEPGVEQEFVNTMLVCDNATLTVSLVDEKNGREIGVKGNLNVNVYSTIEEKGVGSYQYIRKLDSGAVSSDIMSVDNYINEIFKTEDDTEWSLSLINNDALRYGEQKSRSKQYTASKERYITSSDDTTKAIINGLSQSGIQNAYTIYVSQKVQQNHNEGDGITVPLPNENDPLFYNVTWMGKGDIDFATTSVIGRGLKINNKARKRVEDEINNLNKTKIVSGWKKSGETTDFKFNTTSIMGDITLEARMQEIKIKYHPEEGEWVSKVGVVNGTKTKGISDVVGNSIKFFTIDDVVNGDMILSGWSLESKGDVIKDIDGSVDKCDKNTLIANARNNNYLGTDGLINVYAIWDIIRDETNESDTDSYNALSGPHDVTLRVSLIDEDTKEPLGVYGDTKVRVYTTIKGAGVFSYIRKEDDDGEPSKDILKIDDYLKEKYKIENGTEWTLGYINNEALIYGTSADNIKQYTAPAESLMMSTDENTRAIVENLSKAESSDTYQIYVSSKIKSSHNPGDSNSPVLEEGKSIFHKVTWDTSQTMGYTKVTLVGHNLTIKDPERKAIEEEICTLFKDVSVSGWRRIKPQRDASDFIFTNAISSDTTFTANLRHIKINYHKDDTNAKWTDPTNVEGDIKTQSMGDSEGTTLKFYSISDVTNSDKILLGWSFTRKGTIIQDEDGNIDSYNKNKFIERARDEGRISSGDEISLYAIWEDLKDETTEPYREYRNSDVTKGRVKLRVSLVSDDKEEIGVYGDVLVNVYTTNKGIGSFSYLREVSERGEVSKDKLSVKDYMYRRFAIEDGTEWTLSNLYNGGLIYGATPSDTGAYLIPKEDYFMTSVESTKAIVEGLNNLETSDTYTIYVSNTVQIYFDKGTDNTPVAEKWIPLFHRVTWKVEDEVDIEDKVTIVGNKLIIKDVTRKNIEKEVNTAFVMKAVSSWMRTKPIEDTKKFDFEKTIITDDTTLKANMEGIKIKYNANGGKWQDEQGVVNDAKTKALSAITDEYINHYTTTDITNGEKLLLGWSFTVDGDVLEGESGERDKYSKVDFIEIASTDDHITSAGDINLYAIWDDLRDEVTEEDPRKRNASKKYEDIKLRVSLVKSTTNNNALEEIGVSGEITVNIYTTDKGLGKYSYIRKVKDGVVSKDKLTIGEYIKETYKTNDGKEWSISLICNEGLTYSESLSKETQHTAYNDDYIASNEDNTKTIMDGLMAVATAENTDNTYTIYVDNKVQTNHARESANTPIPMTNKDLFHKVVWQASNNGQNYEENTLIGNGLKISIDTRSKIEVAISDLYKLKAVSKWKKKINATTTEDYSFNTLVTEDMTLCAELSDLKIKYHSEGGQWVDLTNVEYDVKTQLIDGENATNITYYAKSDVVKREAVLVGWSFVENGAIIKDTDDSIDKCDRGRFLTRARQGNYLTSDGIIHLYAIWEGFIDDSNEDNPFMRNANNVSNEVTLKINLVHNNVDTGIGPTFIVNCYELKDDNNYRYLRIKNEDTDALNTADVNFLLQKKYKVSYKNHKLSYIDKDKLTYATTMDNFTSNQIKTMNAQSILNTYCQDTKDLVEAIASAEDFDTVILYVDDKATNPEQLSSIRTTADPDELPDKNAPADNRHIIDIVTWKYEDMEYEESTYVGYGTKISSEDKIDQEKKILDVAPDSAVIGWRKTALTSEDPYVFDNAVKEDTTLEPILMRLKVKYVLDGGAWPGGSKEEKIEYINAEGVNTWSNSSMSVSKSGYSFYGWSLTSDGKNVINKSITGKDLIQQCISKSMISSDGIIVLYAMWAKIVNGGGGSGGGGGGGGGGGSSGGSNTISSSGVSASGQPASQLTGQLNTMEATKISSDEILYYYDENQNKYQLISLQNGEALRGIVDVDVVVNSDRAYEIYEDAEIGLKHRLDTTSAVEVGVSESSNIAIDKMPLPSQGASTKKSTTTLTSQVTSFFETPVDDNFVGPVKNDTRLDYVKHKRSYVSLNNNLGKDVSASKVMAFADSLGNYDATPKTRLTLTYCLDELNGYMYEGWKMFNGSWYYFLDAKKYGYMLKEADYKIGSATYSFDKDGRCINPNILPTGWEYNINTDTIQYKILGYLALDYDYKNGNLYAYDALTERQGKKRYGYVEVYTSQLYFDTTKDGACYVGPMNEFLLGTNQIENKKKYEKFAKELNAKQKEKIEAIIRSLKANKNGTNTMTTNISNVANTALTQTQNIPSNISVSGGQGDEPTTTTILRPSAKEGTNASARINDSQYIGVNPYVQMPTGPKDTANKQAATSQQTTSKAPQVAKMTNNYSTSAASDVNTKKAQTGTYVKARQTSTTNINVGVKSYNEIKQSSPQKLQSTGNGNNIGLSGIGQGKIGDITGNWVITSTGKKKFLINMKNGKAVSENLTGWCAIQTENGSKGYYHFEKDGTMSTGVIYDEAGNMYYAIPSGINEGMVATGWYEINGQKYYFSEVDGEYPYGAMVKKG